MYQALEISEIRTKFGLHLLVDPKNEGGMILAFAGLHGDIFQKTYFFWVG
jgi:hypothetical protein